MAHELHSVLPELARTLYRGGLDLLYPRVCCACGASDPEGSTHLCWSCRERLLPVVRPYCEICGDPVSGRIDRSYVCALCHRSRPKFEKARSALRYEGPARDMLRALKFHGATWLADDLAAFLEACVQVDPDLAHVDALVAVPQYPAHRRRRGFNQAGLLARCLSKRIKRPLLRRGLVRVKQTSSQTNLTASQRADNVQGAFEHRWGRWLEGRRFLLVDDVMTTGATVRECAAVLRRGGASRVNVLTVARG